MITQLDIPRFLESTGGMDLLALIGTAYIRQLPQWRADFSSAIRGHDIRSLAALLHKMKGSCYAVGAHAAAAQFQTAELTLPNSETDEWAGTAAGLLSLVDDIERELMDVIAAQKK